jgi:glyoxylate reductase
MARNPTGRKGLSQKHKVKLKIFCRLRSLKRCDEMSKPKVFITRLLPEDAMRRVLSACDADVWNDELPPPREVLLSKVQNIQGLLCLLTDKIDAELLDKAPGLKVISNLAVGFDNIEVEQATKRGIAVGYTPGVLTETTADFAFALMMTASRRIIEGDKSVRRGDWKTWGPMILLGQDVFGSTLGIIGLGRIGAALARRAKGFDMKVIYYDVYRQEALEKEIGIQFVSLDELLRSSDFISIHTNLTKDTFHLIGKKEFEKMKKNCVIVNTARGPIIDNIALFEALVERKIFAAGLDVTEPEPLPKNHPLLTLDNFVVTPHIASASINTRSKMANIAVDNLLAGLAGDPLPFSVNPQIVKRKD